MLFLLEAGFLGPNRPGGGGNTVGGGPLGGGKGWFLGPWEIKLVRFCSNALSRPSKAVTA